MQKIENLIQEPLKEKLKEVMSKPKRQKIRVCRIVASTDPKVEAKCKQLRQFEYEERRSKKTIPVLFMCGIPKRITKSQADWYMAQGMRVEYHNEESYKALIK